MNQQSRIERAVQAETAGFTAREFLGMLERGAFADMRVELIGGVIEKMLPAFMNHGECNISLGAKLVDALRGTGYRVGSDLIIVIDENTVRAADIAVAGPDLDGDRPARGEELLLAVEIAENSLARDVGDKKTDYARAAIPNYWIVDLKARAVRVMGNPSDGEYRTVQVVRFDEPLSVPGTNQTITIG